jgi:hypothetical protein
MIILPLKTITVSPSLIWSSLAIAAAVTFTPLSKVPDMEPSKYKKKSLDETNLNHKVSEHF